MIKNLPLAAAFVAAFTLTASAEDYDLRKLFEREFSVGSKYLETSTEDAANKQVVTKDGQVVQQQDETTASREKRLVEILAADSEGKPSKFRYTYQSMSATKAGEKKSLEVKGLVVLVDISGDAPKVEAEGEGKIPSPLHAKLMGEARKDMTKDKKAGPEVLFPEKPVALGTEWTKDPQAAMDSMGMTGDLVAEKSSVKCKLVKGEGDLIRVVISIDFVFTTFQGMACEGPMVIHLDVEIHMAPKGPPLGQLKNGMTLTGKVSGQGVLADMSMKQEGTKTRTAAK